VLVERVDEDRVTHDRVGQLWFFQYRSTRKLLLILMSTVNRNIMKHKMLVHDCMIEHDVELIGGLTVEDNKCYTRIA
jgi:hypothetical protein